MASQLPTSTSLLTSPTNFQGIPISQLLAALYGDTTTPSTQYAKPVMHSSSASFRKGIDPRNRPKAGGESEAARGSRLLRERRAREAARKGADTTMRVIGGMTGGTVGTKPTKPAAAPKAAAQPVADRRYDAAEAARAGARTMGAPSSIFRAPEATPVSRTFDDPTIRPEVAAAYARVGTPEQNAERRAAELAANREREAANAARREAEAAEMAALNRDVALTQGAVSGSEARLNALRQAERDQEIAAIRGLPTGLAGNLSLADVERAVLSSPQVLGRVAYDATRPALRYGQDVGSIFLPSIFGERGFRGYR